VLAPVQLGTFQKFLQDLRLKDGLLAQAIDDHLQSELERALEYHNGYTRAGLCDSETWVRTNADLCFIVDSLLRQIYQDRSALSLCNGELLVHAGLC